MSPIDKGYEEKWSWQGGQEVEGQECVILSRVIREELNSLCSGHTDLKVNWKRYGNRYLGKGIRGKGNGVQRYA